MLRGPDTVATRLQVQEATTLGQLQSLQEEWFALWQESKASPFQSPMWLLPWWNEPYKYAWGARDRPNYRMRTWRACSPVELHPD